MSEFRMTDTRRPNGAYVKFERRITPDQDFDCSDFEPSVRREIKRGLKDGSLVAVGVQAVAHITLVRNGVGTLHTVKSAGLWGVVVAPGDDPYLAEVYEEELAALRGDLDMLGNLQVTL